MRGQVSARRIARTAAAPPLPKFLSVGQAAQALGVSTMTLYRDIAAGEFPAVRVRGRYVIPARALEEMESEALATGGLVYASDWVPREAPTEVGADRSPLESRSPSSAVRLASAQAGGRSDG